MILCGCATDSNPSVEKGPGGTIAYEVIVESEQPGCRIEVDGDYVGMTPIKIKVFGDRDGTFHSFGTMNWVIKAYPPKGSGGMVQVKQYGTGGWFTPEAKIPKRIYFNTDLDAVKPKERIDVNINQN